MTTPWHEQYKPRLVTVQVTAVPPGAVWCHVGSTIYIAQYEQFFVGGLAPGETLEAFDRYWERPMSDWALAFGGLRWKERVYPVTEETPASAAIAPPMTTQWSHPGPCDLPGSLCKPEDVCQRCGRPAGEHANYPANTKPRLMRTVEPVVPRAESVAEATARLVAHLEATLHDERVERATHALELLDVAVAKRETAEGALEECLGLLREVPLWDDLARIRLFKATTGALAGGAGHPHRCVCQDAPDAYPGTPHTHYEEPPHACARCTECRKYRAAVPTGPTIDWRARVAALLAKIGGVR